MFVWESRAGSPCHRGGVAARRSRWKPERPVEILIDLIAEDPGLHPPNGEQIAEGFEEAIPDAVFGFAVKTGVVGNRDFRDGETFHFEKRWNEAMKAAVELQLGYAFAFEGSVGAASVRNIFIRQLVAHPIGDAAGGDANKAVTF